MFSTRTEPSKKLDGHVRRCRNRGMGLLRVVIWSVGCVGLGVGLSTVELGGRTPLQHAEKVWKDRAKPKSVDGNKASVTENAAAKGPSEQHTVADRSAIDQIIAKHQH
jgi:hypothetical protein